MERNVHDILNLYNPHDPLDHAWTIPSRGISIRRSRGWSRQRVRDELAGRRRVDQVQKKRENFSRRTLAESRSSWRAAKTTNCAPSTTSPASCRRCSHRSAGLARSSFAARITAGPTESTAR